jgi:hypothetical protein
MVLSEVSGYLVCFYEPPKLVRSLSGMEIDDQGVIGDDKEE